MTQRRSILFLTSSEYGQANVVLAVAHELASQHFSQVHIASFSPLKTRIDALNSGSYGALPWDSRPVSFHLIPGLSMMEAMAQDPDHCLADLLVPASTAGALSMQKTVAALACIWKPEEYIRAYRSCRAIIDRVQPDIIVVEAFLAQAVDACNSLKKNFVMLSPNTYRELLASQQSQAHRIWGYPMQQSGIPFPVPWHLVPLNMYIKRQFVKAITSSPHVIATAIARKVEGITSAWSTFNKYSTDHYYIVPATPECDLPCPHLVPNMKSCGPIVIPYLPLTDVDPELEEWLKNGPTIMFNFGSHWSMSVDIVTQIVNALRIVFDRYKQPGSRRLQILWKLKAASYQESKLTTTLTSILGAELKSKQLRIEPWLNAEPASILASGQVVCSVHHGGANSYYEAVDAGVPQIILPCWLDTHDFAERVEFLGIGVHGSRGRSPEVDANQLTSALLDVIMGQRGKRMRLRARELADTVKAYGGRKGAAKKILELCDSKEFIMGHEYCQATQV